jgi:hypothetical protein
LYPYSGCISHGHHNIAWEVNSSPRFSPDIGGIENLLEEINSSDAKKVIISSEDFEKLGPERIKILHDFFRGFHVRIIAYLRRQDRYLQSLWTEQVKTVIGVQEFRPWLSDILTQIDNRASDRGDYFQYLEKWASEFGHRNIIARVLEATQLQGHVLVDFLIACDHSPQDELFIPNNMNISPSYKTLEIMRIIKQHLENHIKLSHKENRIINKIIRGYAKRHKWDDQRLNLIDLNMYTEIMERFRRMNQLVAKKYFKRNQLFLEEFQEHQLATFTLNTDDVLEILELHELLISRLLRKSQ